MRALKERPGDSGITSTINRKNISKTSKVVEALGTLDELVSYLGIIRADRKSMKEIFSIQQNLMTISSIIAGAKGIFPRQKIDYLQDNIIKLETKLPKLGGFVIPGDSQLSAQIHYARALTRKAERRAVGISFGNRKEILAYLNRLSSYLFDLALAMVHLKH